MRSITKPVLPVLDTKNSLSTSLIVDLPFYDGKGTTVTDLVAGRNGTFDNTPTWTFSGAPAGYGINLDFDTAGDRFHVTKTAALNGTLLSSFQVIFKLDTLPPIGQNYISNFYGDDDDTNSVSCVWRIGDGTLGNQNKLGINFKDPSDHNLTDTTVLSVATWYNVIITTDGTNGRFYINGVQSTAPAYTITPQAGTIDWYIGGRTADLGDTYRWFDGKILLIRRWTRTLSAAEVASLNGNPFQIYFTPSFEKNSLRPRPFAPGRAR